MIEISSDAMESIQSGRRPYISIRFERHGKEIEVQKEDPTERDADAFLNLMSELATDKGL